MTVSHIAMKIRVAICNIIYNKVHQINIVSICLHKQLTVNDYCIVNYTQYKHKQTFFIFSRLDSILVLTIKHRPGK